MAIPHGIQTAACVAGTVITAVGLNLGVIGLNGQDQTAVPTSDTADTGTTGAAPAIDPAAVGGNDGLVMAVAPLANPLAEPDGSGNPDAAVTSPVEAPPAPAATASTGTAPSPTAAVSPPSLPAAAPGSQAVTAPPQAPAPTTPPGTAAPTTAPPAPAAPAPSVSPTNSSAPATAVQPATQTEYLSYEFAGIADVVVALHDGSRLEFWSVDRAPGWVSRVDDDGPRTVKVKFMRLSDGEEAEFVLELRGDGRIDVKMED